MQLKNTTTLWIVTLGLIFHSNTSFSQIAVTSLNDSWSGTYQIKTHSEIAFDTIDRPKYIIEKTVDGNPKDVTWKYKDDLAVWSMFPENREADETLNLRQFLMNDDHNDYEEFGWTALYNAKKMKCLDGGHLIICQTTKETIL